MGPENIDRYSASWNNMDWTVSNQLLNAMAWNTNSIQLSNWITLNPREFSEYYKIARNSIIEKYWFSEADILEFHKGLQWIHLTEVPWHPNWRWCSEHKILNWESNAHFTWTIYINPRMINNSDLFFSVLYHELDHYAFYFKKFNDSKIPNIQLTQQINLWEKVFLGIKYENIDHETSIWPHENLITEKVYFMLRNF